MVTAQPPRGPDGPADDTRDAGHGVVAAVIGACLKNKVLTLVVAGLIAVWGAISLRHAPLDAIPDLSDTQVIVFTEWAGRSPDLIEDQVTYPITTALLSAPKVKAVRGQSMFGMSFVYVIFEDGTDVYWARSRVLELMATAQARLPEGVVPTLGPDATGVGWVFQYALVDDTGQHDLAELRTLQDYRLRYALEAVPGVAEVATVGGFVKQYQIQLDPDALLAHDIGVPDVVRAVRESNQDVGGRVVELAGTEHMVRGRGYVHDVADLEEVPLAVGPGGVPVLIKNVGQVSLGPDQRRGVADLDGRGDTVGGIVVMRTGENALDVIAAVKARLAELAPTLPAGVRVQVTYDRSELIEASIATLQDTLIEEMVVVSVIIFLFLLHVRSALVPILTLPIAVLVAFIPMAWQGLTVNIMSLGGIAVAIGAMVDASIIIVENVHHALAAWDQRGRPGRRDVVIRRAIQEVGPSIFFSLLVITVAFVPIFTLEGVEGRLFKPLAFTKTYAMGFAAVLAVTVTPVLAAIVVRGHIGREDDNPINRLLTWAYAPVVRLVLRHRALVLGAAAVAMAFTIPVFFRLPSEFMPPLNEGAVLYMPTSTPGMSEGEAQRVLQLLDASLHDIPEVATVFGKMGRADTPTDPAPLSMAEITLTFKPRAQWRPGMDWAGLMKELDQKVKMPGMPNVWWMPIQTRTEMLSTGVRSKLGIKVFGDTLEDIETAAKRIEAAVPAVPGTRSAFAERVTGGFYIDFTVKRAEAARHGLRVDDVNAIVMSAIGGLDVSTTVEGRARFPISVRYAREYRDSPEALGRVLIHPPTGGAIPISQVADVRMVTGPPMIRSEAGRLVGYVFVDVDDGVAIGDYVAAARPVVAAVELPEGVRLEWAGQFRYLERARDRLKLVVPITLLLVILLLYLNTRSVIETAIVLLAVPFSLIGAFWLLYLLDYHLSVAVWVGIIALAGLDAETGVVMLLYLTLAHRRHAEQGRLRTRGDLDEAIVEGAARRIRPKLMTVLTTMIGLVPILWSTGTGADVMKRIAAPMVGGLATSFLLELTLYPVLFSLWKQRGLPRGEATPAPTETPGLPPARRASP
ncbi:MAG: efflux RND transporter permease subunit [Kofleriaceae bacterium]|nr:efflux RND transporter permease subunit [Myxococcales bacterium]MCB9561391.1 efflux RND transporter permease subunit [Kofleriaceae bacterium]